MKSVSYILLGLLLLLTVSCIKEDRSDCFKCQVYFYYDADATTNVFDRYVDKVNLFVYDKESGELVKELELERKQFENEKRISVDVKPGNYTLVAWGNSDTETSFVHSDDLQQAYVTAPEYLDGTHIDTNSSLYFAYDEIEVRDAVNDDYRLDFNAAHIDMVVRVFWPFDRVGNGDTQGRIEMTNLTPTTTFFELHPINEDKVTYYPALSFDGELKAEARQYKILRYQKFGDEIEVNLYNNQTGELMKGVNLVDYMNEYYPTLDILQKEEVTVEMNFHIHGLDAEVTVTPWQEEDIKPGN